MAVANVSEFLKLLPALRQAPEDYLWMSYDREAEVV